MAFTEKKQMLSIRFNYIQISPLRATVIFKE